MKIINSELAIPFLLLHFLLNQTEHKGITQKTKQKKETEGGNIYQEPDESTICSPSTVSIGTFLYSDHFISFLFMGFTSTTLYPIS